MGDKNKFLQQSAAVLGQAALDASRLKDEEIKRLEALNKRLQEQADKLEADRLAWIQAQWHKRP